MGLDCALVIGVVCLFQIFDIIQLRVVRRILEDDIKK